MSTTEQVIETGRRRRRHSAAFKAEAIGACQQAGISVAAIALARGINANLLRKWLRTAERTKAPIAIRPSVPTVESAESFVPVTVPAAPASDTPIRIELRRKGRSVSIEWPATAAQECALRPARCAALLRGLILKCFRPFVASWPAPSASGRSERGRAGIAPAELVHLRQGTHNNHIENRSRPVALGRNNWLFAGSLRAGQRAAAVMSLIQSAKLNRHDSYRYLKDVLDRLPTQPASRLDELLPHRWRPSADPE